MNTRQREELLSRLDPGQKYLFLKMKELELRHSELKEAYDVKFIRPLDVIYHPRRNIPTYVQQEVVELIKEAELRPLA